MKREDVQKKRYSVIGAARSGLAVARLLAGAGARVFVSESSSRPAAEADLKALKIPCEFGGHTARLLETDVLVLSPGVPSSAPPVRDALAHGITVVSELEAASWFSPGPIIAITGTNGKTTTTTLAGRMFEDARRPAVVGGNIGTAFSDIVTAMTAEHTAVLEVSSFQLDHVDTFHPKVAVLLNITPDHLDRYEHSMDLYIRSKCRVFARQGAGDMLIYNADDEVTSTAVKQYAPAGVTLLPFSAHATLSSGAWVADGVMTTAIGGTTTAVIPVQEISIRGTHNLYNAMAATLAAQAAGINAGSLRATMKNFKGVEHRLEHVRVLDGVTYVNDSKATNVDSVWYALQSFEAPLVVLIGGRDKGNDYSRLNELVKKHCRAVIAIGESAEKVVAAFSSIVPVERAAAMPEAVQKARACAAKGDVVLLSPACASFDWFDNYEHRGKVFKEIVHALPGGAA
jgi:UDP-N-acetylmuramoylalanine--D-glutamate ligase